jgi:hypothetical protein
MGGNPSDQKEVAVDWWIDETPPQEGDEEHRPVTIHYSPGGLVVRNSDGTVSAAIPSDPNQPAVFGTILSTDITSGTVEVMLSGTLAVPPARMKIG